MTINSSKKWLGVEELEYLAFHGHEKEVCANYITIPETERHNYDNHYILYGVIRGGIDILNAVGKLEPKNEKLYFNLVEVCVHRHIEFAKQTESFSRELFQSILIWVDYLNGGGFFQKVEVLIRNIEDLDIRKYPDLYVRATLHKAYLFNSQGKKKQGLEILSYLSQRPYLLVERNMWPTFFKEAAFSSLENGVISDYKIYIFHGLSLFFVDEEKRLFFIQQIIYMHRNIFQVLVSKEVAFLDKLNFVFHLPLYIILRTFLRKIPSFTSISKYFALSYLYLYNYFIKNKNYLIEGDINISEKISDKQGILITRAMGGIGDLLMMTPGFYALKQKYPKRAIYLAIPKRYFSIFSGNSDVKLVDIENDVFTPKDFYRWFNFTDCPAARVESRTVPNVKQNRIDIFARALGLGWYQVLRMKKQPRYFLSQEEIEFREKFWKDNELDNKKVIGVHLSCADTYRNYPYMPELVKALNEKFQVLLFDGKQIHGYYFDNVIKIDSFSLRNAFALATYCNVIIAPDSSFVHFAGSFDIPCIALFGPTDGKLRTKDYKNCHVLTVKEKLNCVPCWRNENIPCKLTGGKGSVCMEGIYSEEIVDLCVEISRV